MYRYALFLFFLLVTSTILHGQEAEANKLAGVALSDTEPLKFLLRLSKAKITKPHIVVPSDEPFLGDEHVVSLFKYTESDTKCALPINALNSVAPAAVASTIGKEARRMLLGYVTDYYPPKNHQIPSTEQLKKMVLEKFERKINTQIGQP